MEYLIGLAIAAFLVVTWFLYDFRRDLSRIASALERLAEGD